MEFKTHGYYVLSNVYSVEVEISACGTAGRWRRLKEDGSYEISEWMELDIFPTEDEEGCEAVLDAQGLYIPLNHVMRI